MMYGQEHMANPLSISLTAYTTLCRSFLKRIEQQMIAQIKLEFHIGPYDPAQLSMSYIIPVSTIVL